MLTGRLVAAYSRNMMSANATHTIAQFVEAHPRFSAVAFGCVVALVLVIVLELGFRIYEYAHESQKPTEVYSPPELMQRDATLGVKPRANVRVEAHKIAADGKEIFGAHYTIDSHGRRMTTVASASEKEYYALFFGCSFTFGEGVNDNRTLPYFLGKFAPCYKPYNYAFIGYGPQQMLAKLQTGTVSKEIPEHKGILIYGYMGEPGVGHVERAIGSMAIYDWTRHFPHYHLDSKGNLVRNGDFTSGRPILSLAYRALLHSAMVRVSGIDYPFRLNDEHVNLTARIVKQSAKTYEKEFGNNDFYVLIFPGAVEWSSRKLAVDLRKAGIKVLDYSKVKEFSAAGYRIPGDEHPSPRWNEEMARLVARDLGLENASCAHTSSPSSK